MSNEPENEREIMSYVPIGEKDAIKLSLAIAKKLLIKPTKNGVMPPDQDIMAFLMLCRARGLNPFVGDCSIVGYDSQGGAQFSIITSKAALDKRADLNENYLGIDSGIVILKGDTIERREGAILLPHEELLGAWATVYRRDRPDHPSKHDVNLSAYDKERSLWKTDKPGMIVKCAEAGALRKAFPNSFSGLYVEEEGKALAEIAAENSTAVKASSEEVGPKVPENFRRKTLPERSTVKTVDQETQVTEEKPEREIVERPKQSEKPAAKQQKQEPAQQAGKAKDDPEDKPPFESWHKGDPGAEKEKPEPASETKGGETSERGGVHQKLLDLGAENGVSKGELVLVARAFFGTAYQTFDDIPEANVERMIGGIDDVVAEAKALT